eukprot:508127-Pelagomonas_calceolata.AAC.5
MGENVLRADKGVEEHIFKRVGCWLVWKRHFLGVRRATFCQLHDPVIKAVTSTLLYTQHASHKLARTYRILGQEQGRGLVLLKKKLGGLLTCSFGHCIGLSHHKGVLAQVCRKPVPADSAQCACISTLESLAGAKA